MYPNCSECNSIHTVKRGMRKTRLGRKQRYLCTECRATFIEPDGFERMRHKKEDIVRAIHMRNDGFSLFKAQYHLYQHDGIKVSRECIRLWCRKYGNFLKSIEAKGRTKTKRKAAS